MKGNWDLLSNPSWAHKDNSSACKPVPPSTKKTWLERYPHFSVSQASIWIFTEGSIQFSPWIEQERLECHFLAFFNFDGGSSMKWLWMIYNKSLRGMVSSHSVPAHPETDKLLKGIVFLGNPHPPTPTFSYKFWFHSIILPYEYMMSSSDLYQIEFRLHFFPHTSFFEFTRQIAAGFIYLFSFP